MSEADQPVRPRPLSRGFLAWIVPTWKATEDEVILTAGVDAAMYLRIFEYGAPAGALCACRQQLPTGQLHAGQSLAVVHAWAGGAWQAPGPALRVLQGCGFLG